MPEELSTKDILAIKEDIKFTNKTMESWFWYKFHFRVWQNELYRVEKEYNGFGMTLPNRCMTIEDLFANFLEVEIKKTKNKKYQKYLTE